MTATVFLAAGAADGVLADALTRALPRFGRRGAVRVRRTGEPAAADWFLLLASPESATDPAVDVALRQRLAAVGVERMLIVVTAGSWEWDPRTQALTEDSTAAPPALRRAFRVEPRHLVYRGQHTTRPEPRDPLFLEQVCEIVAPIVGTTKDDLAGEDVHRQRRTRRLVRAGAGALAAMLLVAGAGGLLAVQGAAAADRARAEAEQARAEADSRRLAGLAQQVAGADGALERLLAVEAWRIAPTDEGGQALERAAQVTDDWAVTTADDGVRRLIGHGSHPVDLALSNTHAASVDVASVLRIWSLEETSSPVEIVSEFGLAGLAWSHDGTTLAAAGGRVYLFDAAGGSAGFAGPRAPAHLVGPWGGAGFVAGGGSVALIEDGTVVAERAVDELGFTARTAFVHGTSDGQRVLAASEAGQVVLLDAGLDPVAQWQLTVEVDQFGERDSLRVLAWDGADRAILPPDNATILGPVLGADGVPDGQDNAIAGVYDVRTGEAIEPVRSEVYLPLPATSAVFLPDGSAIALSPGGLESPPAFGGTAEVADLSFVPLPPRAEIVRTSPNGAWLAVAGGGEEAHVIRLGAGEEIGGELGTDDPDDPVGRACAAAGRNLTRTEWAIYLPDRDHRATCEGYDVP